MAKRKEIILFIKAAYLEGEEFKLKINNKMSAMGRYLEFSGIKNIFAKIRRNRKNEKSSINLNYLNLLLHACQECCLSRRFTLTMSERIAVGMEVIVIVKMEVRAL